MLRRGSGFGPCGQQAGGEPGGGHIGLGRELANLFDQLLAGGVHAGQGPQHHSARGALGARQDGQGQGRQRLVVRPRLQQPRAQPGHDRRADNASAVGAFISGEVDFVPAVDDDKVEILEGDAKVLVSKRSSNSVIYAGFNLKDGSKFKNQKLRQAVLNAVEQEGFIAVYSPKTANAVWPLTWRLRV